MNTLFSNKTVIPFIIVGLLILNSCDSKKDSSSKARGLTSNSIEVVIEAESFTKSNTEIEVIKVDSSKTIIKTKTDGWIAFDVVIPVSGRYKLQVNLSALNEAPVVCWVEDYIDNKDDRTYNITGSMSYAAESLGFTNIEKDGAPLKNGIHRMKLHFDKVASFDFIRFTLLKKHETTPFSLTQKMNGKEWKIVWSDEFDNPEIDTTKWTPINNAQ